MLVSPSFPLLEVSCCLCFSEGSRPLRRDLAPVLAGQVGSPLLRRAALPLPQVAALRLGVPSLRRCQVPLQGLRLAGQAVPGGQGSVWTPDHDLPSGRSLTLCHASGLKKTPRGF